MGLAVLLILGVGVNQLIQQQRRDDHAAALVRQLLDANLAQTPAIIEAMKDYRDGVEGRLRDSYRQAEESGDAARQLHASLALLPSDATQTAYLVERLLDAEPQEVAVLRAALRPHQDELRETLWQAVLRPRAGHAGQRLRAAARWLTMNPRIRAGLKSRLRASRAAPPRGGTAAAEAVAQDLVTVPPFQLAAWLEAFRPIRRQLLGPLQGADRDSRRPETQRAVATDLLAAYAADRPDILADLSNDAEPRQYAVLFPVLERNAAAAVPLLRAELARTPSADWPDGPLDPAWSSPRPQRPSALEQAQGMLAERFALCQTLPLDRFDAVADALRQCGYRPIRLAPTPARRTDFQSVVAAAVWTRDGRPWHAAHGLTPEQIRAQDKERRQQGFQPVDVAGYSAGNGERYAALWVKGGPADDARLYVGVVEQRHQADGWGPLAQAKLQPATLQTLIGADGQARYSSVWRKGADAGQFHANDAETTFADRALSGLPLDVTLSDSHAWARELLAWLSGSPWAALWLHGDYSQRPHPEYSYAGCFIDSVPTTQLRSSA